MQLKLENTYEIELWGNVKPHDFDQCLDEYNELEDHSSLELQLTKILIILKSIKQGFEITKQQQEYQSNSVEIIKLYKKVYKQFKSRHNDLFAANTLDNVSEKFILSHLYLVLLKDIFNVAEYTNTKDVLYNISNENNLEIAPQNSNSLSNFLILALSTVITSAALVMTINEGAVAAPGLFILGGLGLTKGITGLKKSDGSQEKPPRTLSFFNSRMKKTEQSILLLEQQKERPPYSHK